MSAISRPPQTSLSRTFPRKGVLVGILALTMVVLVAYSQVLNVGFFGDDWIFYELAGRLNLADYASKYLDPYVQTAWYRPLQGLLFRIGYDVFGTNQMPYHLVQILIHLANCILLFLVIGERLGKWLTGFVAAALFATMPIASEAVFRTGVIDPVTAFLWLLTLWLWLRYLECESPLYYGLAFLGYVAALLSKEIAVSFPVTLVLFDRFAIAKQARLSALFSRYAPFFLTWIIYFPIEYLVTRRSVFISREGYAPGLDLLSSLWSYLGAVVFPWGYQSILSSIWLVMVASALAYVVLIRRHYALIPIIAGAVFAILPIIAFPQRAYRFVYLSLTASAFLIALLVDRIIAQRPGTRIKYALWAVIAAVVVGGGFALWKGAADYGELARVSRVPFRNFRQAHPTLPADTLVYFIDAPVPGTNLSGMIYWFYGKDVIARANDMDGPAGLRDHAAAFVSYLDAAGNQREQSVDENAIAVANAPTPVNFAAPVRLEGWELVNSAVKESEPFILLLYWRGLAPMETDYIVSIDLIDSNNNVVQNWSKSPRGGTAPTSTWPTGEFIVDVLQLTPPASASMDAMRLELALVDPGTKQRVPLQGANADVLVIQPVSITP